MALNAFNPDGYASFSALSTSSNLQLPGTGSETTVLVTNMGPSPAAVLLGSSNAVVVNGSAAGVVIMPGGSLPLTRGTNTWLAAIALGFGNAQLNVAVGS